MKRSSSLSGGIKRSERAVFGSHIDKEFESTCGVNSGRGTLDKNGSDREGTARQISKKPLGEVSSSRAGPHDYRLEGCESAFKSDQSNSSGKK